MNLGHYKPQVRLLLDVIPSIAKEQCFALKGGTAINLFVRDLPRLSVDIDLTYLGDEPREQALPLVEKALHRIQSDIESRYPGAKVIGGHRETQNQDIKLVVQRKGAQVKIEANPVIRGTLLPSERRTLVSRAIELFEVEVEINVVHLGDLYGGKIVAALDRQHPRDLFDVKLLFENEGISDAIRDGFIAYLLSHPRPLHEVISPTRKDMRMAFGNEFEGMTAVPFTYKDFEETRERLILEIAKRLSRNDHRFLVSFARGKPDWPLFGHASVQLLPAVQWKLQNISKMTPDKKMKMADELEKIFRQN